MKKNTYVENFETSNIEHTNEVLSLLLGVQGLVTPLHKVLEETIENTLRQGTYGVGYLEEQNTAHISMTVNE